MALRLIARRFQCRRLRHISLEIGGIHFARRVELFRRLRRLAQLHPACSQIKSRPHVLRVHADRLFKVFRRARVIAAREIDRAQHIVGKVGIRQQVDRLVKVVERLRLATLNEGDLAQADVRVVSHQWE